MMTMSNYHNPVMLQECIEALNINPDGILALLNFSAKLEKEKERIEELLYDLAFFARHELFDARRARVVLDGLRFLKRKANLKLALDVMCLRLGRAAALSGGNGNDR